MSTHIPRGYTSITPYLIIENAAEAIRFYEKAFDAVEGRRMEVSNRIMHTEVEILGSKIMIADEFEDQGFLSPTKLGGSPVLIHLYVVNAEDSFQKAIDAGASTVAPVAEQFFGDKHGVLKDPFGYIWTIATHVRTVPDEVIAEKLREYEARYGAQDRHVNSDGLVG